MASIEPGIALVLTADGYRIEQHRPPVGTVLCRLPVDEALDQVTRLLPICGDAQHIAAARNSSFYGQQSRYCNSPSLFPHKKFLYYVISTYNMYSRGIFLHL